MKATWLYGAVIGALVILSGAMYMTQTKEAATVITLKDEGAKEVETEASPELMMVYVTGAVATPDVYAVPKDSRLYEIIDIAGGFSPEASKEYLNLARMVFDGEQIHVPLEATVEALGEGHGHGQGMGSKVSLNQASKEQLMTLKGVGEARAEAIIDYRKRNGPFKRPKDIMNVRGIKEAMYEKIKNDITI